jgi:hypothetical protein
MVAVWSDPEPTKRFEPWTCSNCPSGKMVWFACDLPNDDRVLRHRFACDKCHAIEHIAAPFTPAAAPEAAA